ncbi:LOW QUALITY PROTEIN: anoctamin-7-like, partial [Cynocephalus volans]|uniref:LOW QUALITY PROTEIN: anoctamin-7-like n=1 Tax=Cynocephalus volans TaxID=110931 RepID=UPI002FCA0D8D
LSVGHEVVPGLGLTRPLSDLPCPTLASFGYRSRRLGQQAQEEDSTVLIDTAPPPAQRRSSYRSTAHASEPGAQQVAAGSAGSPAKPLIDFVLVWEEDLRLGQLWDKTDMHGTWRERFLDNLCMPGLCVD